MCTHVQGGIGRAALYYYYYYLPRSMYLPTLPVTTSVSQEQQTMRQRILAAD